MPPARAPILLSIALFAVACGGDPASPPTPPTSGGVPTAESCEPSEEEGFGGAYLTGVEATTEGGADRLVLQFDSSSDRPPAYSLRYPERLLRSGEGRPPAEVEGNAFVELIVPGLRTDFAGNETFTGPDELHPGFAVMQEAELLDAGTNEDEQFSLMRWGIGLSGLVCPRVLRTPTELIVEFPTH